VTWINRVPLFVPLVEFGPIRLVFAHYWKMAVWFTDCLIISLSVCYSTDSMLSTLVWWNQSTQRQQARWWHSCLSLAWLLELDFLSSSPRTSNTLINHSEDHSRGILSQRLVLKTWSLTSKWCASDCSEIILWKLTGQLLCSWILNLSSRLNDLQHVSNEKIK